MILTLLLLGLAGFIAFKSLGMGALPAISGDDAINGVISELADASAYIEEQTEPGSIDRAQGQRFMLRIIERNMSLMMSDHNGATPTIDRCPTQLCKYGFDNPDTTYVGVGPLSSKYKYRLSGNRGTVAYVTYQMFNIGPTGFKTGDQMESGDLVLDDDGNYEIILGSENDGTAENFMVLTDNGSARLIIRQLHNNWNTEIEQSFKIEVLNGGESAGSSPVFNDKMIGRRALGLKSMIKNNIGNFREIILNEFTMNSIPVPEATSIGGGGGFPSNHTSAARYELGPGQALLIEVPDVQTIYKNIQLANLWGESLDYATRTVSYNGSQSFVDVDGKIRYVIAMEDPGVPNWLDATGHPKGALFMRWQSPREGEELEAPGIQLVAVDTLRDHLPGDHPVTDKIARAKILQDRLLGYNRRKNPTGE